MARDFKRASSADPADIPQRDRFKCAAYGCPMPGTLTESVHGSDTWYCHKHFFAKRDEWQQVTRQLRSGLQPVKDFNPFEDD